VADFGIRCLEHSDSDIGEAMGLLGNALLNKAKMKYISVQDLN
jgi:hypothetical protein